MYKIVLLITFFSTIFTLLSCSDDDNSGKNLIPYCDGITIIANSRAEDDLYIKGDFNGWQLSTPMIYKNGHWEVLLKLTPGDYAYRFYSKRTDEEWLDPNNPLTMFSEGVESSRLIVKSCRYPKLEMLDRPIIEGSSFSVSVKYVRGSENSPLDKNRTIVKLNGVEIDDYQFIDEKFIFTKNNLEFGKYSYSIKAVDQNGLASETLFIPIWVEDKSFVWEDAFIYQIMTDRFKNGDLTNDSPNEDVNIKANWQGGDFKGIIEKIDSGYFTDMGVNAIWISSPIVNTQTSWKGIGNDIRYYSAYHSYWPIATGWTDKTPIPGFDSPIEPHFGTDSELKELINKAHKKGIRVLFDFVPNHVHTDAYLWETYRYQNWFNMAPEGFPVNDNGGYTCGWEQPILCWFTNYLADINHKNIDALNRLIDHLIWMIQEYNIDGLRLDAIRLMELNFTTTLKTFIQRYVITTGIPFYMVGETFTNDRGWDEIGYYLGEDKLDGQFDFPLFHHISRTFLIHSETFSEFSEFLSENDNRYQDNYYEQSLMSNFIGNHDVCRALSVANYDFADDPNDPIGTSDSQGGGKAHELVWENSPETPIIETPFKHIRLAHTFLFTTPGIPTIYQGDEFGMPGANDPDNRRMMIFDNQLSQFQKITLNQLKKLGNFRLNHPELRYGKRKTLLIDDNFWAYSMSYQGKEVIVVFNRKNEEISKNIPLTDSILINKELKELFTESSIESTTTLSISLPSLSSAIYYLQ